MLDVQGKQFSVMLEAICLFLSDLGNRDVLNGSEIRQLRQGLTSLANRVRPGLPGKGGIHLQRS